MLIDIDNDDDSKSKWHYFSVYWALQNDDDRDHSKKALYLYRTDDIKT